MANYTLKMIRKAVTADFNNSDNPTVITDGTGMPRHARIVIRNESSTNSVLVGAENVVDPDTMFSIAPLASLELEVRDRVSLYGYKRTAGVYVNVAVCALPEVSRTLSPTPEAE